MNNTNKLLAVWDAELTGNYLGYIVIFLAELENYSVDHKCIDVAFISNGIEPGLFVNVIQLFTKSNNLYILKNRNEFNDFIELHDSLYTLYPSKKCDINKISHVGSTLYLQDLYCSSKNYQTLMLPYNWDKKTTAWLREYCDDKLPVVVHLKNNPHDKQSNANHTEWFKFFSFCKEKEYPVKFIIIGNDKFEASIDKLENVLFTKNSNGLTHDLALILKSFIFMGMSSGPCNVALLSSVPFIIFKHPEHHPEEMQRELNEIGKFSFSSENQEFCRAYDTFDNLVSKFENLYNNLNDTNTLVGEFVGN